MNTPRDGAAATANQWFHSAHGSGVYQQFQAEYLAATRTVFLELALHKLGRSPRRILDVGCGGGEGLAYLAARLPDAQLHGIDPQAAMLERAHALLGSRCRLSQASLLDYEAGQDFDLVVSYSTFRFWEQPALCLRRMRALLAPAGLGYLLDLHGDVDDTLRGTLLSQMRTDEQRSFLAAQLDAAYGLAAVRAIVAEAGLPATALHVGGFAGYAPRSREAFELLQQNEHLAELIFGLNRSGFKSDRGHESVFYLTLTN